MRNYSGSKCSQCQSSSFEVVEETPIGSNFKMMFIRCSSCKTVIGITDYYNIGNMIKDLGKALNVRLD